MLSTLLGSRDILAVGDLIPIVGLLVLGAALGASGRERYAFRLMASIVVALLVFVLTPIVSVVGRRLVRSDPPAQVDAVVVLGGGVTREELMSQETVDRMLSGLERTAAPDTTPIVTSVVRRGPRARTSTEADTRRMMALAGGRRVHFVRDVFSTRDEAEAVRALATRLGWRHVAVVTSPSHSGRACRTFEGVGLIVSCWPSPERRTRVADAVTVTERLNSAAAVLYEIFGFVRYRLRGWA